MSTPFSLETRDMLRTRHRKNNYFMETKAIVVGPRIILDSSEKKRDVLSHMLMSYSEIPICENSKL